MSSSSSQTFKKLIDTIKNHSWILPLIVSCIALIGYVVNFSTKIFPSSPLDYAFIVPEDTRQIYSTPYDSTEIKLETVLSQMKYLKRKEVTDSTLENFLGEIIYTVYDTFLFNHPELYHCPYYLYLANSKQEIISNVKLKLPFKSGSFYEGAVSQIGSHNHGIYIRKNLKYFNEGTIMLSEIRPGQTVTYAIYSPHTTEGYEYNSYSIAESYNPFFLIYNNGNVQPIYPAIGITVGNKFEKFIALAIANSIFFQFTIYILSIFGVVYILQFLIKTILKLRNPRTTETRDHYE